ncbi:MAG TPA: universal stress protein [Candidatus Binatia bacterium]|nr:universal stress protein [Candidatus Binatia bacterium]
MFSKILVPLDGSGTAEKVLPFVRCFARGLQIPVELLGVVDIGEMARHISADQAAMVRSLVDDSARRLDDYLQRTAKNFPTGKVECTVRHGNAAEVIIESAAADRQTLIAMATHGRSGVDRWLLGSVTEKVLRAAANPMLIVRASEENSPGWHMGALKRVLVPLDGSKLSESILPVAQALARNLDLEIVLLSVYSNPFTLGTDGDGFYNAAQLQTILATLRAESMEYLALKAEELKKAGFSKVSSVAEEGRAADAIIASAQRNPDCLVAMCTHGRSGVKRWVLGSVTETVVRHLGAPVLVARPTDFLPRD